MAFEKIYGLLLDHAPLSDRHRKELTEKRGFSDGTIKKEKFGSGGAHLLDFEKAVLELMRLEKFREQDLIASGVFIFDPKIKTIRINPILLNDTNKVKGKDVSNILIPYRRRDGEIETIRPHKLGFKDVPTEIYQEANLTGNPPEIIITEGEFKAVAAMQYGLPCIAVPGIQSFSEKKFPELAKLLIDNGVQRAVIMFDNETKDDPAIEHRYKANPIDRYDTQFYSYYMAYKLEKAGIKEVVIATLPDAWKVDGKIDIDGCAATGKHAGDLKKVIYDAKPRNEFLGSLDAEAKQVVLRKNNQKYHRSKVKREFNRYVVTRASGNKTWEETISNFVMRVIATHDTPEGVKREIEFVDENNKRSNPFTIGSKEMSSAEAFRTFALSKGDFVWRGRLEDLLTIWESEFLMMDEGRYIVESDHLGWIEREKIWLFGNIAIDREGKEIRPDKSGIFWLEKRGIKPIPLSISTGRNTDLGTFPTLHTSPFDIHEVRRRLGQSIGVNEACVALGWITAVAFMEEIFDAYRSFPFFFVTGKFQSGKTTVAEWIVNFFGIEETGKSISQTTAVAIQRSLAYFSSLPFHMDEYRNTKDIAYKNGFLRNVYNRQGAGKGVKDDFGLRDAKVRGTLLLSGEETPKDPAVLSRCIVVFVSRAKREADNFNWFNQNRSRLSYHFYDILKRKKELIKPFGQTLNEWKDFFTSKGVQDRVALNYAIVVAGHAIVFGHKDLDFANWLLKETQDVEAEHSEEQAVNIFLEDLMAMKTRGLVDDKYWLIEGDKIYFYFHGLHQVWAQEFKKSRGEESFKEGSIRAYLKEEKGYIDWNVKKWIKGMQKKCVVFDYNTAPDALRELIENELPTFDREVPRVH